MKIAVSGATGFIGRHVVADLERRGLSPTLWLRPGSQPPEAWSRHEVVCLDIDEGPQGLFQKLGRPDVLIHLAWGGLPNYQSLHHFEHELPAQYRMLKGLVADGLKSVLVSGTCFEYGAQSGPLAESSATVPSNPYGMAKDMLRRQLQCLQRELPFALTWGRLFYLHGPGQGPNSLWSQLKRAVDAGDATFPMSGGEQLRDYLPAAEAASLLVRLALLRQDLGPVNVCSGAPISVRNLVEGWIAQQRWSIRPEFGRYPYPSHEPLAFWGDVSRLRACLQATATDKLS